MGGEKVVRRECVSALLDLVSTFPSTKANVSFGTPI